MRGEFRLEAKSVKKGSPSPINVEFTKRGVAYAI